jgi:hypothetical protein
MTVPAVRLEQYYNALIGRGRPGVTPTIREVQLDRHRVAEAELPFLGL